MKLHLPKLLLVAVMALPLSALEWSGETTGDQTVTEDINVIETATIGNVIFDGGADSHITVSGDADIGGSGNLTISTGSVTIDGVSRTGSTGHIDVNAGATLELTNGTQILTTNYNNSSNVNIRGTLKVDNLQYQSGNLGALRDNTGSIKMYDGSRLEITQGGSASIGLKFEGWGATYTIALAAGAEDAPRTLDWATSGTGGFAAEQGGGNALNVEVGQYAQLTLGKDIGTGLSLNKKGEGELVYNGTINLDNQRGITVASGTLTLGDSAQISSAGSWFNVDENGTLNMNGKAGGSNLALQAAGSVTNAQNNEMTITLTETGKLSLGADASSGYSGSLILTEGAEVDLGGYIFYNAIDVSAGGSILNADHFRGSIVLGVDEDGYTDVNSEALRIYGSSLASAGSLRVSLSENFESTAPDFDLLKGRMYAAYSVEISGETNEESISITGYTTEYGAVSAQNGEISITNVEGVTLSDNHAVNETIEDYNRAGALSATEAVTIEASGAVVISENSASVNSTSAGAVYAGTDVSITGAEITINGNTTGGGDPDNADDSFYGGAIKSDGGLTELISTEGAITISNNKADGTGGAIYASAGVYINSASDINITGNTAIIDNGGAIYSDDAVVFTPGEEGKVTIRGNEAGANGGAIYSGGTVTIAGGTYEIADNAAGSYGGAIYAANVEIAADAGDVTFSGNTHDGGTANDIELDGGTATLSASGGHTLALHGGITGAVDMSIGTDSISAVNLGGTSSTENLFIEGGRVYGISNEDGSQAVINITSSVTLSNAYMQDVALVDEYIEASLTSSDSTYIFNDVPMDTVAVYSGDALTHITTAPLLNGFTTIDGVLSIGITYDFLKNLVAEGETPANVILTLTHVETALGDDGFTFILDQGTVDLLESSVLESYGFYDADGNLIGEQEAQLLSANGVTFAINGITKLVPEPTTSTLSLLALAVLCMRRRRKA